MSRNEILLVQILLVQEIQNQRKKLLKKDQREYINKIIKKRWQIMTEE